MHYRKLAAALVVALTTAVAAGSSVNAEITVTDGWVRGVVPGQTTTGAFMRIQSTRDVTLIGAASPAARVAEVHSMQVEGGVMKMQAVERLPIAAGKTVELKPGGFHIMLTGLTQALKVGDSMPLTLSFEDKAGGKSVIEVKLPVKPLSGP